MWWLIFFIIGLSSVSYAKFSCLPNNVTCIDGTRYYKCTEEDIELSSRDDVYSTMIFMQTINNYLKNHTLYTCDDGYYCSDDPEICLPEYKPGNECSCNKQGYACLSPTRYMYCDKKKREIVGNQAIECPKDEVCYFIGPTKSGPPCMKAADMPHTLSVHCYSDLDEDLEIVKDYSEYCDEHYPGFYLLPDKTDCSRYLYCNDALRPNFEVLHCPPHHGFNYETEKCEKDGTFSCIARACDMSYNKIMNYNQKDCKSYYECNGGHDIELANCSNGTLFDPILQSCTKTYTCPNASHSDYVAVCKKFGDTEYPLISDVRCQSYVDCYAERPDEYNIEHCAESEIFDFGSRSCVLKTNQTICPNQQLINYCENKVGSFIAPSDYMCNVSIQCDTNPNLITPSFCENGYFNYETGTCDVDYVCPDNVTLIRHLCVNQYKNLPDPIFHNCKYYIACRNHTFARLSCPDLQLFDPDLGECSTSYVCDTGDNDDDDDNEDEEEEEAKVELVKPLVTTESPTTITTTEKDTDKDDEEEDSGEESEKEVEKQTKTENTFLHLTNSTSLDFQNFEALCAKEKNGSKLSNCSDATHKTYVECIKSNSSTTFIRHTCKSPTIFCAELQRCTSTSSEPCACVKEFNYSVYLPFYPFYPVKNIEYNQTCRHELNRFKTNVLALPNPFNRVEFFVCRKSGAAVNFEWGRCCNGFEFCSTLMKCTAPKSCPSKDSVNKFQYVFSVGKIPELQSLNKNK